MNQEHTQKRFVGADRSADGAAINISIDIDIDLPLVEMSDSAPDTETNLPLLTLLPYERISGRAETFLLITREDADRTWEGIHCLICRLTSWHSDDVQYRFCEGCKACHQTLGMLARLGRAFQCQRCQTNRLQLPPEATIWPDAASNGVIRFPSGATLSGTGAFYCPSCSPTVVFCADCGCTDEAGCPEGCSWATPETCSACLRMPEPGGRRD